jgi:RNA recognition motif-containing protein
MPTTRLFVGNLPYATTEGELKELFARVGTVASARIVTDFDTGRSKGYGFVEMASAEEAAHARESLNGFSLGGRSLVVDEARSKAPGGGGRGR